MKVITTMLFKIKHLKSEPHPLGHNELKQVIYRRNFAEIQLHSYI